VSVALAAVLAACSGHGPTGVDASLLSFSGGSLRPAAGTMVVSSAGRKVATGHSRDGSFSFDLHARSYTLDGTTSKGVKCVPQSVTIRDGTREILTLECI
jgi:hypothetical protein